MKSDRNNKKYLLTYRWINIDKEIDKIATTVVDDPIDFIILANKTTGEEYYIVHTIVIPTKQLEEVLNLKTN